MGNKPLIDDDRLTPTMERSRSGSTQMFREKGIDNAFTSGENADVILNHENKSMYAELIDDKWYWVNGCAECVGEPRDWMTYIECVEHDVCRTCNANRKDVEVAWGGKPGWQCGTCHDIKENEIRIEAFEKLDGEEPDCHYTDDIICPHCGSEVSNDELYESQDTECYVCKGEMFVEVEYSATYTTVVKGERITE